MALLDIVERRDGSWLIEQYRIGRIVLGRLNGIFDRSRVVAIVRDRVLPLDEVLQGSSGSSATLAEHCGKQCQDR